jgi:hypothetical protein
MTHRVKYGDFADAVRQVFGIRAIGDAPHMRGVGVKIGKCSVLEEFPSKL